MWGSKKSHLLFSPAHLSQIAHGHSEQLRLLTNQIHVTPVFLRFKLELTLPRQVCSIGTHELRRQSRLLRPDGVLVVRSSLQQSGAALILLTGLLLMSLG